MRTLYRPGRSLLHRAPAGVKLIVLALVALILSLLPLGIAGSLGAVAGASLLFPVAGFPLSVLAREWWRLRGLVVVLGACLWVFVDAATAVTNTGRVVALLLLAALMTSTTPMLALMATLCRALEPFRRFGANPEAVALALSLTLAMIPVLAGIVDRVRDAYRARGLRRGVRCAVPVLVLTMRQADAVSDALAARGIV